MPSPDPPYRIFVVSGSHFDLGWCGDPAECLAYSDSIIRAAIDAITGDVTPRPQPGSYQSLLRISRPELNNGALSPGFGLRGLTGIRRLSDRREVADTSFGPFAEPVVIEDRRGDLEDAIEEQREKELWSDASLHAPMAKETLTGRQWCASKHSVEFDAAEAGPVRASMRLRGKVLDWPFEQVFSVYDGLDRIDLVMRIDRQGEPNTLVTLLVEY